MEIMDMINRSFWKGKKVFLTGHTGFKGSWLAIWLQMLGAEVIGYGLKPKNENDIFNVAKLDKHIVDIRADVRDLNRLKNEIKQHKPDIVFHLAAQPLVLHSYQDPVYTYETNVMGTLHLLEAIRESDTIRAGIIVTSDKCYENKEQIWGYRENDPMGGYDPYSSSKGCAEILTASYRNSFFNSSNYVVHQKAVATVRAGNVIGGGDWSEHRLVPDCISSLIANNKIEIRNPKSIRPWQHVIEPLHGYLILAEKLFSEGTTVAEGWNFGPDEHNALEVEYVVKMLIEKWNSPAEYKVTSNSNVHEATYLKLDCSRARTLLQWHPKWNIDSTIQKVVEWTQAFINGEDMFKVSQNQIKEYY
nr:MULTISPECIES: CDP-glucose 4,6-dehydratase [Paenibacillus]